MLHFESQPRAIQPAKCRATHMHMDKCPKLGNILGEREREQGKKSSSVKMQSPVSRRKSRGAGNLVEKHCLLPFVRKLD